jgi:hypothetical protein
MNLIRRIESLLLLLLIGLPFSIISAPVVSVDKVDYNLGEIYQDENNPAQHTFIITNTGDSTLVIKEVKSSCGCTTVGYDSEILPGKTGKITQAINLKNIYAGHFKKDITIFSNAKNPEVKLSLGGTLRKYVETSSTNIRLTKNDKKIWTDSLILSTEKKDLTVSEVTFKLYNDGGTTPAWQTDLNLYPKFTFSKISSADKKLNSYSLKINFISKDAEPKFGEFIIKTNHPKMPIVTLSGSIDGNM